MECPGVTKKFQTPKIIQQEVFKQIKSMVVIIPIPHTIYKLPYIGSK